MALSKLSNALLLLSLCFLTAVTFAESQGTLREKESKKTLEKSRSLTENEASSGETVLVEDTTQRFQVAELQIRGNHLISTSELLSELPAAYIVSTSEDGVPVKEIYDFRVIRDIVTFGISEDNSRIDEIYLVEIPGRGLCRNLCVCPG